jgi:hypothetical protein
MDTSGNGTTTTSATTITLNNLTTNFTYNIFICAYYSSTIIGKSNTYLTATTSTISPTALYNYNPSLANSISVGFTLVTELGGSEPLNYIANAFALSDTNHLTVVSTVTGSDSPLLLTGLSAGTTYQVQVGASYSTSGAPSYSAYFNLSTDPGA